MATQLQHDLLPQASHDELARQNFAPVFQKKKALRR